MVAGENDHIVGALERKEEIVYYRNKFLGSLIFSLPLMVAMIIFMIHPFMAYEEEHKTILNSIYMILATPAVLYFGKDYFIHAYSGLKRCQFTMDTLVAVGVGGAYVFSILALGLQFAGINATCYFDTAAELITFMLLGKFLEAAAKAKTSDALVLLLKLTPPSASLIRTLADGTEEVVTVPSASLAAGDRVRVAAGDKIPVDGTVSAGVSEVDEAAVTGESLPRQVGVGSKVVGGTINAVSVITVTATAVGSETVVAQIIKIVEDAQRTKPAIQRFADRIAGVFVPCVLAVSAIVFFAWIVLGIFDLYPGEWRDGESPYVFAFQNFLSTLVVACPCALGLATPTAIMVGTGVGAEMGVLAKSGIVLETAPLIDTFIFDKTGTLTTGKLSVTSSAYFSRCGALCAGSGAAAHQSTAVTASAQIRLSLCADDLRVIALVESMATHPIAVAITQHIRDDIARQEADAASRSTSTLFAGAGGTGGSHSGPLSSPLLSNSSAALLRTTVSARSGSPASAMIVKDTDPVAKHTVIGGKGISAEVGGVVVKVGTVAFIQEGGACTMPQGSANALELMRQQGRTIVAASVGPFVVGLFGLADQPKPEARRVVAYLHERGKKVMMVTGDNEAAALRIAREVGIPCSAVVASCMPADKERIVTREQQRDKHNDPLSAFPSPPSSSPSGAQKQSSTKVAFIGDGINDSPALAQADIGIALGAGTDIAIECADAVLMHDSLKDIIAFVDLARTVVRRIRLNFAWALGYNLVMLPVAAGLLFPIMGKGLPPVVAGIAMIMSSLSVLMSSLTLRCYSRPSLSGGDERDGHFDSVAIPMDDPVSDEREALTRAVREGQGSGHGLQ